MYAALFGCCLHAKVVVHERPDEDGSSRTSKLVSPQPGILHRFVCDFQKQPLLWIYALRRGSGGDGVFGNGNDVVYVPTSVVLEADGLTSHISLASALPAGLTAG